MATSIYYRKILKQQELPKRLSNTHQVILLQCIWNKQNEATRKHWYKEQRNNRMIPIRAPRLAGVKLLRRE